MDGEGTLRRVADAMASAIRADAVVAASAGRVTVCVEDRQDMETAISEALGKAGGICVMVGIAGFERRAQSGPVLQGTVSIEVRAMEVPALNRSSPDGAWMTAQGLTERLALALHWRRLPGMTEMLRFRRFVREDGDAVNVARGFWELEQSLVGPAHGTTEGNGKEG